MKLKHCPKCNQDLLMDQFTSSRAKFCKPCKRIIQLEQHQAMTERSLARTKIIKRKTVGIVRLNDLKKTTQIEVNRYCKLRDRADGCISCDKGAAEQGGHYVPQGSSSFLRYNLDNINGQCHQCNYFKSGNVMEYRIRLVKKIGEDKVRWLEDHRHEPKKWTREELENKRAEIKLLSKTLY